MQEDKVREENNLRYRKPIRIVKELLREMDLKAATDIWIYPQYPFGWEGAVGVMRLGSQPLVYVFKKDRERIFLSGIYLCRGFRKNGSLIY